VARGNQHDFEWPHRPEGHQRDKVLRLEDDAFARLLLEREVIANEALPVPLSVFRQTARLLRRLIGNMRRCPDLAVRVRIARAHHHATVFENLDVAGVFAGAKFCVLLGPDVHHRANIFHRHAGKGEVVPG